MEKSKISVAAFLLLSPFCMCLESSTSLGQGWGGEIVIFVYISVICIRSTRVCGPTQTTRGWMYPLLCKHCIISQVTCKHWRSKGLRPNPYLKTRHLIEQQCGGWKWGESEFPYLHPSQNPAPPSCTWHHPRSQQEQITLFCLELSMSTIIRPHIDCIQIFAPVP